MPVAAPVVAVVVAAVSAVVAVGVSPVGASPPVEPPWWESRVYATVSPERAVPGGQVSVSVSGLGAGETAPVFMWASHDPDEDGGCCRTVGTVTADSTGRVSAKVTVPADQELGYQPLEVHAKDSKVLVFGWFTVVRPGEVSLNAHEFEDVAPGVYFDEPVRWLASYRITTGCGHLRFCPHDPVSRGQVATFLWRLAGRQLSFEPRFDDVPEGVYYDDAAHWLRSRGLTTGVGGSNRFEPDRGTTRGEFVTLLHRFAGQPSVPGGSGRFVDVESGVFFERAVRWAAHWGITTGVGGSDRFEPHRLVSRGEAATLLRRYAAVGEAHGPESVHLYLH